MAHFSILRVFYRGLRGYSLDKQKEAVKKCIQARGLGEFDVKIYTQVKEDDGERECWVKDLGEEEIAMVARLTVIPHKKAKGKRRPLVDFTVTLAQLTAKNHCAFLIEAESNITSVDGKPWEQLVEWSAERVASGRELSPREGARIARVRWDRAEPGIVDKWASPLMAKELKLWTIHWRSREFKNAREAFAGMPDDVRGPIGSLRTAQKIFGKRCPNDPKAGGRPPKAKKQISKRKPRK